MLRGMSELIVFGAFFIFITLVCAAIIIGPVVYFDGRSNARILKETRGIELPWYDAVGLDVSLDDKLSEVKE